MLKNYIRDTLVPKSLTDTDLHRNGISNIVSYSDLENLSSINQLPLQEGLILLYQLEDENTGHWTSLFRNSDGLVEYFDPYGKKPDHWLFKMKSYNNEYPYLTQLLLQEQKDTDQPVVYNEVAFQKNGSDISTCGRWCILRLKYKNLPLDMFQKCFGFNKISLTSDELVSLII